jgi:carboxypeptidase C (cathepsin A)
MTEFLKEHPELTGRDFYITGESYAGHYIPAIAYHFLYSANLTVNLKGIAIGDGLVDPYNQYPAYATFSYEEGLINKAEYDLLVAGFAYCQRAILTMNATTAMEICQL